MGINNFKKDRIEIDYRIEMRSRFHCGSGYPFGLIDRMAVKDGEGYLVIPGSTIKGLLRNHCEKILSMCRLVAIDPHDEKQALSGFKRPRITEMIFGSRFHAGTLYFNNALMSDEDRYFFDGWRKENPRRCLHLQSAVLAQTSVSRLLGTVKEKVLFNSEFGLPNLAFQGKVFGLLTGVDLQDTEVEGTDSLLLLLAALYLLETLGSDRTRGAGRCQTEITNLRVNGLRKEPLSYLDYFEWFTTIYEQREG